VNLEEDSEDVLAVSEEDLVKKEDVKKEDVLEK